MRNMPMMMAPLSAFLIGLAAVPAVRRIALACGFLDKPDRRRKLHCAPVALGGGIALWLATWSGWAVGLLTSPSATSDGRTAGWFIIALAVSSFLMLLLGVVDDAIGLRARYKLAGQLVPAIILVSLGMRIDAWRCFGFELELGVFACPVTVIWILLIVNAFNLIDGMDGFCGSLGLIASLAIAVLASTSGRPDDVVFALALAAALAAFLWFNLPPAKIFLGDAGSMTIGLFISALSIRSCSVGPKTVVLLMPAIALLMLPLLDVLTALGRRWLRGLSIFAPDRGHIHHCMRLRLRSVVATLGAAGFLATLGAGGAVMAKTHGLGDPAACLAVALSIGLLTCTNTFGATETRLLLFRLKGALAPVAVHRGGLGQECHLRGNRDWAAVWDALVKEGEAIGVYRIDLAIEMPAAGELYHGRWSLLARAEDHPHWSIVHTLHAGDDLAGTISVSGNVDICGYPYLDRVERLVRVVEDRLVASDASAPANAPTPLPSVNLAVN